MLGLPDAARACLFDLDGVLTKTAVVHAAAWKEMFDDFLRRRDGPGFAPFTDADYNEYVDGKPRYDGVRSFLASRGIALSEGAPDDPPGADTVMGLGNRKNELVLEKIKQEGVERYEGSVRYVEAARGAGIGRALVGRLTEAVLDAGRVPYYSTAVSNLRSRAVALGLGYWPAWTELYARDHPRG
jgi:beta-phosphoglucomutase-like phosphatase (HAD superfamily)